MDNKTYQKSALRTNGPDYLSSSNRLVGGAVKECNKQSLDLLHACMGLSTEAGEFQDAIKKHIFYGKDLDKINLKEELGDILWYCAIALSALNTDFESVMGKNIDKLKARYPEKFTEDLAINRDVKKERKIIKNEL
jgi:NTP pyrophosphatase (non-canonical NTP hydrolase)